MTNAQQSLVSPKRLAELYSDLFTVPTLQRWRTEGTGPPYSVLGPRRIVYRLSDIEAYLAKRTVTSTAAARERNRSEAA
jgi:predicted DNA-binding transcriptional regulator AlpA